MTGSAGPRPGRCFLVGVALLVLTGALACSPGEGGSADVAAAEAAAPAAEETPGFTLPDLEGRPVTLAEHRGKVVIVDFWATWCPPCIFQVPELNQLWNAHKEAGDLMVIGVAVDVEGAEIVGPWVEEQGVDYTIVLGDEGVAAQFGAMGFPTLVVIAPDGTVDSLHVGLIEAAELENIVAGVGGRG